MKVLPRAGGCNGGRGQAGAVAGDRGAERDAGRGIAAADGEAAALAGRDLADVGDDAGEHESQGITLGKGAHSSPLPRGEDMRP